MGSKSTKYAGFLIVCLFLITFPLNAQVLIHMEGDIDNISEIPQVWGSFRYQDHHFILSPDLQPFEDKSIPFRILDKDAETGSFFWIEARNAFSLRFPPDPDIRILWNEGTKALVRIRPGGLQKIRIDDYFIKRISFKSTIKAPSTLILPEKQTSASLIQTILDSVSQDRIMNTVEQLSGESACLINGQIDTILTRYSYSPGIHKARDYLTERFQGLQLPVEHQTFRLIDIDDIAFSPDLTGAGWFSAGDRIYHTSNSGGSWQVQFSGNDGKTYWSVFSVDDQIAYAVGSMGTILHTSDGGTAWNKQASNTSDYLFGLYFANSSLGWICGDNGIILKTTDGGVLWTEKSTPVSNRLYDIFFIDDNHGWTAGRDGTILYTLNGGESWFSQNSGTEARLYGVYFLDTDTGYAVGWEGIVLQTNNGGTDWVTLTVPSQSYFYDIDFSDANNGMIVGWTGACLKTTNGGDSWTQGTSIMGKSVYGMDMISPSNIWVGGQNILAKSTDLGVVWQEKMKAIRGDSLGNIITVKTGTQYPDEMVIICAHYDSRSENPMVRAPGADDNASGSAAVIEAAHVLIDYDFKRTVKFILFPGEEQGLFGSAAYAEQASVSGENIVGVVNLDMIAYDSDQNGRFEIHSGWDAGSNTLGSYIRDRVSGWNLSLDPVYLTSGSSTASDHSTFWNYGYPAVLIIEDHLDFTPFYHTTLDVISSLRPSFFRELTRLAVGSLALLAEIDSSGTGVQDDNLSPESFILNDPYPNPFNPTVHIEYSLNRSADITVTIYDLLGRTINILYSGTQTPGQYRFQWNGQETNGEPCPSGVYFAHVQTNEDRRIRKIILLR